MPDAVTAIAAFVLGGLFNAVVSAATVEYHARRDHRRLMEREQVVRSMEAAAGLLEEIDRVSGLFSSRYKARVSQAEIEPSFRIIRRRAVEFANPAVRRLLEEIADDYYYHADSVHLYTGTSQSTYVHWLQETAREVLGSVQRAEPVPDLRHLPGLRRASAEVQDAYQMSYEAEMGINRETHAREEAAEKDAT